MSGAETPVVAKGAMRADISPAEEGRPFGFFASADMTTASRSRGTSGASLCRGSGALVSTRERTTDVVSPLIAGAPAISS
jgi:hypothetical protein